MRTLSSINEADDLTNRAYVDNVVHVGAAQPTGSELWVDTVAPDPTELLEARMAELEARIVALEASLR